MFLKLCQYVKDLLNIWYVQHLQTQKMCNEAVQSDPWMLQHVPDQVVTQKMCDEAVKKSPCALWWYKGYEQRKAQKAKIKEELMPVAWHPD